MKRMIFEYDDGLSMSRDSTSAMPPSSMVLMVPRGVINQQQSRIDMGWRAAMRPRRAGCRGRAESSPGEREAMSASLSRFLIAL